MKALSISGFFLSLLSIALGFYNQFTYVAAFHAGMCDTDPVGVNLCKNALEMKISLGVAIIIMGIASLIMCLIPTLKKQSVLPYMGILISIGAIIIGLMQSTHFFDPTGYFGN